MSEDSELIAGAIPALAGYQVTDVEEVYRRFGGEGDPGRMPKEVWKRLCQLLKDLGYRERWVRPRDGGRSGYMWVRDPWPIDFRALRGREVETYVRFD